MLTEIVAPCHWDKKVVEKITEQNNQAAGIQVTELYGAMPGAIIPNGRSPESLPGIDSEGVEDFRRYLGQSGLGFTYLLNAPFRFLNERHRKNVDEHLDWIAEVLQPDAVTISSLELATYIRKRYAPEKFNIYISTIAGVRTVRQYDEYMEVSPARIVLHHDANRDWKNLEAIVERSETTDGAKVELMLTESCLRGCLRRDAHYKALSLPVRKGDEGFHTVCNSKKITYPSEILRSNIIRPEDMAIYEDMGVRHFKITGRSKPAGWLQEVTGAYLARGYAGNLMRLLGIDPSMEAEQWITLKNKSLDGFLQDFPRSGDVTDEEQYCEEWAIRLYQVGAFSVNDGSEYSDNAGVLKLQVPGARAIAVLRKEER